LKQGDCDFAGRERFTDVAHQEIDNRSPSQSARNLLTEGRQAANQIEIGVGTGRVGWKLR
jgi:hypothetical protein